MAQSEPHSIAPALILSIGDAGDHFGTETVCVGTVLVKPYSCTDCPSKIYADVPGDPLNIPDTSSGAPPPAGLNNWIEDHVSASLFIMVSGYSNILHHPEYDK